MQSLESGVRAEPGLSAHLATVAAMVTFHSRVRDLLRDGASLTILCHCLRATLWTPATLNRFAPHWRVWSAVDHFCCGHCGRRGKVRDMMRGAVPVPAPAHVRSARLCKSPLN